MNEKLKNALLKLGVQDFEKLPARVKRKIKEFETEFNKKSVVTFNYKVDPPVRREASKLKLADLYEDIIELTGVWLEEQEEPAPPPPPPEPPKKKKGFMAWLNS